MIYLACPYSDKNPEIVEERFKAVSAVAAKMVAEGEVVFAPITYGHTLLSYNEMPTSWDFWKHFCIEFLRKCSKMRVLTIEGWDKSRGVLEEIEFAKENNIPVEYISL